MKKQNMILFGLIICSLILIGCQETESDSTENTDHDWKNSPSEINDINEEQRQNMLEEREQIAQQACDEKTKGDLCIIENPMGEMQGTCSIINNDLTCLGKRPQR